MQPENMEIISGDLFESGAQVLVNPINTVGVMGAGLAKEFARRGGKEYVADYEQACKTDSVSARYGIGHVWTEPDGTIFYGLATKENWRDPSEYEYVFRGLWELGSMMDREELTSVAVPALGCGLGHLELDAVKHLIAWIAEVYPNISWKLYLK